MVHLDKKNYRICNAIRTLILRSNFSELLSKLESEGAIQEKMIIRPTPKVDQYLWQRNGVSHHFVLDVRRGIDCYTISIPFGQIDALCFQS